MVADTPQFFGMLRERLSVVTSAWFMQREFTDVEILRRFQDSLAEEKTRGQLSEADRDQYLGMSLRELVREFKWQTLVLLKCCLLQHKVCPRRDVVCGVKQLTPSRTDAFLRDPLRAAVYDAVLAGLAHSRTPAKSRGLRRAGTEQL